MDVEVWQPTVELVMRFEVEKKKLMRFILQGYIFNQMKYLISK